MIDIDKDYLITVDLKNSSVKKIFKFVRLKT